MLVYDFEHKAGPGRDEVRSALERLFESGPCVSSPRLRAFRRFVIDETLAGRSVRIKAYTIAVGALDRAESFDPARDAIVRVEARRLRAALARYYGDEGADDPIVICIPTGSYVPSFIWRDAVDPGPARQAGGRAAEVLEERRVHLEQFRSNFALVRSSVAELTAELAASRLAIARSQILIERSRGDLRQDGEEERPPPASQRNLDRR